MLRDEIAAYIKSLNEIAVNLEFVCSSFRIKQFQITLSQRRAGMRQRHQGKQNENDS